MTFEEDFPSLIKYDNKPSDDYDFIFSRCEVIDCCLDKVRVREAIKRNVKLSPKGFYVIQLEQFKEDLSLEK
jgi:hypothetical protein